MQIQMAKSSNAIPFSVSIVNVLQVLLTLLPLLIVRPVVEGKHNLSLVVSCQGTMHTNYNAYIQKFTQPQMDTHMSLYGATTILYMTRYIARIYFITNYYIHLTVLFPQT